MAYYLPTLPHIEWTKCIEKSGWQIVYFHQTKYGWRVWHKGGVLPLVKPVINTHCGLLHIQAVFNQPIRVGSFCKRPHKLIDFDNSYERKESRAGS
jgi:hypothetical protein